MHKIVDQVIELILIGELIKAKQIMLDCTANEECDLAFLTGLVFGKLHQINKEKCHSFMSLFKDEMAMWYP